MLARAVKLHSLRHRVVHVFIHSFIAFVRSFARSFTRYKYLLRVLEAGVILRFFKKNALHVLTDTQKKQMVERDEKTEKQKTDKV